MSLTSECFQPCNCDDSGSVSPQCDLDTGKCQCKPGFEGQTCDRCQRGFHHHPHCRFCNCSAVGVIDELCDGDGICECDDFGQCLGCKVIHITKMIYIFFLLWQWWFLFCLQIPNVIISASYINIDMFPCMYKGMNEDIR